MSQDNKCYKCGEELDEIGAHTLDGCLCVGCAIVEGHICECGNGKDPNFGQCYDCYQEKLNNN